MRLSRLPSRVMKALGIDRRNYANALKLIQVNWCAPLDYQGFCPKNCQLCEPKLINLATETRQRASINLMGLWKFKLREAASIAIEEGRAKKSETEPTGTVAEAAARMLQELGVG
jgi:hypothetical protein